MDKDKRNSSVTTNHVQKSPQTSLFHLSNFGNKKVEVQFTTEQISSDGGLLLLKEVDKNIGLLDRIASCLVDNRLRAMSNTTLKAF